MPRFLLPLAALLLAPAAAHAAPFRYPEARHGKGELRYINGLPVLTVEGTPEEIGEQVGTLAVKPAGKIVAALKAVVKERGLEKAWPLLGRAGRGLYKNFPEPYRREIEAMARASGLDLELFIIGNTIGDLQRIAGCSTLAVEPARSTTGAPLFGRNFDFPPVGGLDELSLVVVYRPAGKRAFATVTFPGLLVGGSAINDAGLAIGGNEVLQSADGSPALDPKGISVTVGFRRLLEEADSVAAVEKHLRATRRTGRIGLAMCDRKGGVVLEVTTKAVVARGAEDGLCAGTNHFRSKGLAADTRCWRYPILRKAGGKKKLGVADLARLMHAVNQGDYTIHSMVFEPGPLRLHLSLGKGPASARPLRALELAPLFRPAAAAAKRKKIVLVAGRKSHGPVGNGVHDYGWSVKLLRVMLEHSNVKDQVRVEHHLGGWPRDPSTLDEADTILVVSDGRDGHLYEEAPHLATPERVRHLDRLMKRGCGFATFHFSTFTPEKYGAEVLRWSGGYFQWETAGKRRWQSAITTREAEVRLGAADHPVLRGVRPFRMREEFYYNLRLAKGKGLVPLWVVPDLKGKAPDGNVVAWAREREGGGRGFGTSAGHFYDNWKHADFRKTVLNALVWTAKADVPPGGVEARFYTHDEIRKALGASGPP